jgi:Zn-dependent protease
MVWLFVEQTAATACVVSLVLLASVGLHAIGHILASRATGAQYDEVILAPIGGFESHAPVSSASSAAAVSAGGVLMNLVVCAILMGAACDPASGLAFLNPLRWPISDTALWNDPIVGIQVVAFYVNWCLILVNLIPAVPLDAGQWLRLLLEKRFGQSAGRETALRISLGTAAFVVVVGVIGFKSLPVVLLGCGLILGSLLEIQSVSRSEDSEDETVFGYDFSEGYTSLERSSEAVEREATTGWSASWGSSRRAETRAPTKPGREKETDDDVERYLDSILEKVHQSGLDSLTPGERTLLNRASEQLRSRGRNSRQ